jgi:hypothetical protein
MNYNIRTSECAWQHCEVKVLGRVIKGLRGFSVKKAKELEYLYGAGSEPLDLQEGNKTYEGNIKLLGFEVDALDKAAQEAGYADITEVPHELIAMTFRFQKTKLDKKIFLTVTGVGFYETDNAMEQNAKMREITLPYRAMDITKTIQ